MQISVIETNNENIKIELNCGSVREINMEYDGLFCINNLIYQKMAFTSNKHLSISGCGG